MDRIILVKPSKELEHQAVEYRQEHFDHGEKTINGSEMFDMIDSYDEWLEKVSRDSREAAVDPNWVVTDTFFAIREYDRKIVGIIDFRHELNDFLTDFGHCGYSVRPSERGKGYATEMLRQVLEIAGQIGLRQVQLSCEKDNLPSVRTIVRNGGVYERSFQFGEGTANVYLITL